jgi:hypothetical protein
MGILDDAIREHLDLKRQRGATESELKQLEDEAFGPPSRPGEPDFPGEEPGEQTGNGIATEAEISEAPHQPAEGTAEPAAEEPSASVHPVLEGEPSEVAEPVEAPPSPESEELTTIYDEQADREPDVEAGGGEAPPADHPEDAAPGEAPIESLETVEHPFPGDEPEAPAEPEVEGLPGEAAEPADDQEPAPEAGSEEEGDDDVLADTPEFLKDAPEDDELWFEQGEPKDFDF